MNGWHSKVRHQTKEGLYNSSGGQGGQCSLNKPEMCNKLDLPVGSLPSSSYILQVCSKWSTFKNYSLNPYEFQEQSWEIILAVKVFECPLRRAAVIDLCSVLCVYSYLSFIAKATGRFLHVARSLYITRHVCALHGQSAILSQNKYTLKS